MFSWLGKFFPVLQAEEGKKRPGGTKILRSVKAKTPKARKPPRKVKVVAAEKKPLLTEREKRFSEKPVILKRVEHNPILKPHELNDWESKATFNPAALVADGKVHLIYRAIGNDDVSVLGYAMTHNGTHINMRHAEPAYFVRRASEPRVGDKIDYLSGGGGQGGCEDPRLTLIDDVVYLLYTAFDGWNSIRIGLSSISLDDFLHHRWNWSEPVLISPPGEIHKNWSLFPEKIKGKVAVLSNIAPEIRVDYFDSIEDLKKKGKDIHLEFSKVRRKKVWDTWVRGAGPPPMKTKYGWLVLYHAMDASDPDRYKLGAMLLDFKDPEKILYRSTAPVLEPDECYENEGFKAGVVYSCGAVIIDGKLFVYYGGADSVVCVATADLDVFMKELMGGGAPKVRGVAKPKELKTPVKRKKKKL